MVVSDSLPNEGEKKASLCVGVGEGMRLLALLGTVRETIKGFIILKLWWSKDATIVL